MTKLHPGETCLVGQLIVVDGRVEGDSTCKRIQELLRTSLELIATSDGGWTKLYLDRSDGRLWEHTYPNSDWHGGGPPMIKHVSHDYANDKFGKCQ